MTNKPKISPRLYRAGNYTEVRIGATIYAFSYELLIGQCNPFTKVYSVLPNISLTQATQKHIANFKLRHNLEGGKK